MVTAEITPTEVSYEDMPMSVNYGTPKKRIRALLRLTTVTLGDTCDLVTYIPNLAKIEGIASHAKANATGTGATWSGTVLTITCAVGQQEYSIIGTIS